MNPTEVLVVAQLAAVEEAQEAQLRYRRLNQEEIEGHQERLIRQYQDARKETWE